MKRGDMIPGSRFVRDFCRRCRTPMRVSKDAFEAKYECFCEVCAPHPPNYQTLTPRQEGVRRRQSDRSV
jgi:hypothetical protein